ncbi:hypothetical protein SAMN04489733_2472 [Amycolatopsis keratiniphila]|nr:hypothetical protein SAMN04489733_2472 [Amycolatopsis keratiniphila]
MTGGSRPYTGQRMTTASLRVVVCAVTLYPIWVFTSHTDWMMAEIPTGLAVLTHPGRWGDYLFSLVFTGGGIQTVYEIPLVLAGRAVGMVGAQGDHHCGASASLVSSRAVMGAFTASHAVKVPFSPIRIR